MTDITVTLPDIAPAESLGTEMLTDEDVSADVAIGIWLLSTPPGPRTAMRMMSVRLGDRENPRDLTSGEAQYIARVIENAAEAWRCRHCDGQAPQEGTK